MTAKKTEDRQSVQQQEADSTDGIPEVVYELNEDTSATSALQLKSARASITPRFTFTLKHIAELCLTSGRDDGYARANSSKEELLKKMFPGVSREIRLTVIRMEEWCSSTDQALILINEMCELLESKNLSNPAKELNQIRDDVAAFICNKESFGKMLEEARKQDVVAREKNGRLKSFPRDENGEIDIESNGNDSDAENSDNVSAPANSDIVSEADISDGSEVSGAAEDDTRCFIPSPNSAFHPPLPTSRSSSVDVQAHPIAFPTPNNISQLEFQRQMGLFRILLPFAEHTQRNLKDLFSVKAPQQGVIAAAGNPRDPLRPADSDVKPASVATIDSLSDEGRHSASSGSTRRRTESEESEIVDVVTPDGESTQSPVQGPVAVVDPGIETNTVSQQVPVTSELNNEEAVTSSNSSEDPGASHQTANSENKKSVVEAQISMSPTIGRQEASSAVVATIKSVPNPALTVSTSQMPMSSTETGQPVEGGVETAKNTTVAVEENGVRQEEAEAEKKKKTEEMRKTKKERSSSVVEENEAEEQKSSSSAKITVDPKKEKKKEAPRRMKQLDDSSAESDSDDEDKKKKVRRSTRRVKSPVKKTSKKEMDVNEPEEEEDTPPVRGPRGGKLKRGATGAGRGGRRSKAADQGGKADEDEPPRKRRGRKKAVREGEEEEEVVRPKPTSPTSSDSTVVDELEQCGTLPHYCLCTKAIEQQKNLAWVACNDCGQWFHAWCVRLVNKNFTPSEVFRCCGENPSEEAVAALSGAVVERYRTSARKPNFNSLPDIQVKNFI